MRAMATRPAPRRLKTIDDALRDAGASVWGLCRRLDDDPEDAFQVVFARLAEVIDRFDPDGPASLRTWVVTVAHRVLIDRHRRRRARGEVVELGEVAVESDAEAALDRRRAGARLDEALTRLSEDQRRVVLMHHLHGVELVDIARTEGVAVGTVKSRLHRARARLLTLLGGAL